MWCNEQPDSTWAPAVHLQLPHSSQVSPLLGTDRLFQLVVSSNYNLCGVKLTRRTERSRRIKYWHGWEWRHMQAVYRNHRNIPGTVSIKMRWSDDQIQLTPDGISRVERDWSGLLWFYARGRLMVMISCAFSQQQLIVNKENMTGVMMHQNQQLALQRVLPTLEPRPCMKSRWSVPASLSVLSRQWHHMWDFCHSGRCGDKPAHFDAACTRANPANVLKAHWTSWPSRDDCCTFSNKYKNRTTEYAYSLASHQQEDGRTLC